MLPWVAPRSINEEQEGKVIDFTRGEGVVKQLLRSSVQFNQRCCGTDEAGWRRYGGEGPVDTFHR
jgi:hypothetical protein